MAQPPVRDPKDTRVRPRRVWAGMALALLGLCVVALGLMALVQWLAWAGGAAVLLGLVLAWRGGVVYDTRGQEPPHHEAREVLEGGTHEGVSSESRIVGARAEETAARRTERKKEFLERSTEAPRRGLRTLGAIGLVAVGAWLLVDSWFLDYPFTVSGQDSALRDVGFAVVLTLAGLRLRLPRRSRAATGLCLLAGVLLVLSAALLTGGAPTVRWNELVSGVLTLAFASMTIS